MGSVDIPPFMREQMKKNVESQQSSGDIPPFMQPKEEVKKKEVSDFQPTPSGKSSLDFLPGLNTGSKRSPFIERLSDIPLNEPTMTPQELEALKGDERASQIRKANNAVYAGVIKQPQLYQLYKNGGEEAVKGYIQEYAPDLGTEWMDGDLFHTLDKWDQLAKNIQVKNSANGVALIDKQGTDLDQQINDIVNSTQAVKTIISGGTGGAAASQNKWQLTPVDSKDPASYGRLLSSLQNADGLSVGASGFDPQAKNNLMDLLKQRSMLIASEAAIDPDIENRVNGISQAVSKINSDVAIATNTDLALREKNQYQNELHFKAGLNYIKNTNPGKYNNIVRAIDDEEEISKRDYREVSSIGQEIVNLQKFRGSAADPNLVGTETEFDYSTDEEIKMEYARIIGERAKAAGLTNMNAIPEKEIKRLGADLPYQNIVNTLADEEQILGYDAIPKSGAIEAIGRGIIQPLSGIANTVKAITGSPAETYLRSQRADVGTSQLVADQKGNVGNELPSDRGNVWYDMLEGAGQFIPQVLLTKGIGGPLASTLSADARLALTAGQKGAINTYGGTIISTFAQTYGDAYANALKETGDFNTARLMGNIGGISAAAFETILPDVKIANKIMGGLNKGLGDDLISLIKKGGNPAEIAEKARPLIQKFVTETANIAGQEIAEEDGTQIVDYMTEAIFSPRTAADRDLLNEVWDTTKATAISMALPAIFGGGGAAANNDFNISGLHSAAINFDEYKDALKKSFETGVLSKEEVDRGIKLLATHKQSIEQAPRVREDGSTMSGQDRLDYAYQNTLSKYWNAKAEQEKQGGNDPVQVEHFEQKANEANDVKRKIFGPGEATTDTYVDKTKKDIAALEAQQRQIGSATPEAEVTLSEQEQSAIDAISKKDLSTTGLKTYADVINDPAATPAQKQQALRGISDQLTDTQTAEVAGTALGRDLSEVVEGLNYPAMESGNFQERLAATPSIQQFQATGQGASPVTGTPEEISQPIELNPNLPEDEVANRRESLTPENQTKFDTVDQRINDLNETIDREGGLNQRIEEAETSDNELRANNLKAQREDIYKQLLAAQKDQDALFTPQAAPKGSMVGQVIKTNNAGTWEVTADMGNTVRLFNAENGATVVTKKSALPQPRKLTPEVQNIVSKLSVDENTATQIQDLMDESKNSEEFKRKVKELLFSKQEAGTSQTNQEGGPLNVNEINQEDYDAIAQGTANFATEQTENITEPATRSVNDARTVLENDGGVVWQEFPNGERMAVGEAGGTTATDVNNGESRDRQGNERLHNFGFGLYNGSNETDPTGQPLQEVISGEGYTDRQRGMAAAYLAATRLLNNEPPNYIGRVFQRAANRPNNPRGRIRIYYNENPESGLLNAGGGAISINAFKLGQRLKEFGGEKRFATWLESALGEEVVHLVTSRVATDQELTEVYDEMTDDQRQAVKNLYKNQDLNPGQVAMEFIRQVFQEKVFGTATELLKPKESALSKIRDIARKTLAFLKKTFGGANANPKAKEVMDRMQAFIDGKEVAIPEEGQQAATEAGTSQGSSLDDLLDDLWKDKNPAKPRKKRFTQEQWQTQLAEDQLKQSLAAGNYTYGNMDNGEKALTDFPMTVKDTALMPFQTDVTMQKTFNSLPSEDRYKQQFDMLENGRAMISVAQQSFGGSKVQDYGPRLFAYIRDKMSNDISLLPKKVILLGTFLGELQNEMMRSQTSADQLRPLFNAVYLHYRNYMHNVGRGLNAGKVVMFFKDQYMNDLFSDEILDKDQSKSNKDMRGQEADVEVSDNQTSEYVDQNIKGTSQSQHEKNEQNSKNKRTAKQKQAKDRKPSKKSTFQKAATEKENDIEKKYGGKESLVNKIIDAIKKLNCK